VFPYYLDKVDSKIVFINIFAVYFVAYIPGMRDEF